MNSGIGNIRYSSSANVAGRLFNPCVSARAELATPMRNTSAKKLAMRRIYSPNVNNDAFPPAAVVLIVNVRSVTKRSK